MAQFSHPEFGGLAQWSTGMTMVGDMFNDSLKAKLNAIATELALHLRENPTAGEGEAQVSYGSMRRPFQSWWPDSFGLPSSSGAQNDLRYAILLFTKPASTGSPEFRKRRVPKPRLLSSVRRGSYGFPISGFWITGDLD